MKTFHLQKKSIENARIATFLPPLLIFIVLITSLIYWWVQSPVTGFSNSAVIFIAPGLVFLVFFGGMTIVRLKKVTEQKRSFCIEIDENSITRHYKGYPSLTLVRSEITAIEEFKNGYLQLKTADPSRIIVISSAIENRNEVRALVNEFGAIGEGKKAGGVKWVYLIGAVFMGSFIATMATSQTFVSILCGGVAIAILLVGVIYLASQKVLPSQTKWRTIFFCLILMIPIAAKLLGALTSAPI